MELESEWDGLAPDIQQIKRWKREAPVTYQRFVIWRQEQRAQEYRKELLDLRKEEELLEQHYCPTKYCERCVRLHGLRKIIAKFQQDMWMIVELNSDELEIIEHNKRTKIHKTLKEQILEKSERVYEKRDRKKLLAAKKRLPILSGKMCEKIIKALCRIRILHSYRLCRVTA